MWVAITFAAIALTGAAFIVWVLVALLRESAPSTCCWIVPIRLELEKESMALIGNREDDDGRAMEGKHRDYDVESLENEDHAEKFGSGLIALDVRLVSGGVDWRSIKARGAAVFDKRHVRFG